MKKKMNAICPSRGIPSAADGHGVSTFAAKRPSNPLTYWRHNAPCIFQVLLSEPSYKYSALRPPKAVSRPRDLRKMQTPRPNNLDVLCENAL